MRVTSNLLLRDQLTALQTPTAQAMSWRPMADCVRSRSADALVTDSRGVEALFGTGAFTVSYAG